MPKGRCPDAQYKKGNIHCRSHTNLCLTVSGHHQGDETGRDRRWDSVSRTTRRASLATSGVDAVAILALLRSSANPGRAETLLVQQARRLSCAAHPVECNAVSLQFRPPVDCPTIELPAGLVDEGETAEQAG